MAETAPKKKFGNAQNGVASQISDPTIKQVEIISPYFMETDETTVEPHTTAQDPPKSAHEYLDDDTVNPT